MTGEAVESARAVSTSGRFLWSQQLADGDCIWVFANDAQGESAPECDRGDLAGQRAYAHRKYRTVLRLWYF